jgi:DNA-binding transcriptional LysR family regulator
MKMDWDKLRIFHAVATAGSFTHAGESLHMSQSAASRQISALEEEIGISLFHRHARGLLLTEQGELLYQATHEIISKLENVKTKLSDSKDRPSGILKVTSTVAFGAGWLSERITEFVDLYPDIQLEMIFVNEELDLGMREADAAIRLYQPTQPDIIQRRLFKVNMHLYASLNYIKQYGRPQSLDELKNHRLVTFGDHMPNYLKDINWLETQFPKNPPVLRINSILAIKRAIRRDAGIALLPDYVVESDTNLVQLFPETQLASFDCYFCYPEELRNSARLHAFRDFLLSKAKTWSF